MRRIFIVTLVLTACLLFSSPLWAQDKSVEVLLVKDTAYTPSVDGVFIDLESYVGITYELEKIEVLKIELPAIKDSLAHMKLVQDSATVAYRAKTKHLTKIADIERQSKQELRIRVVNLQHNYNIMEAKAFRWRRQRNGVFAVSVGIVLLKLGYNLIK